MSARCGGMLVLAACLWGASGAWGAAPALKSGDRIIFFGDSITQAGVQPGGYVTLVKEGLAARRPDLRVEIIGAGISGHRVPDLEKRVDADVLARKPSLVVIYIGINDVWHHHLPRLKGTPKDKFAEGLRDLVKKIQGAGAQVVLCTPSVIGERADGTNKLDAMLDEYAEVGRQVAAETKAQLLDLRQAFVAHLKANNAENKEKEILTTDGVHLNAAGNRFVADQVLAALGVTPPGAPERPTDKPLRQVLLFKFKDSATKEQVQEVVDAFRALSTKIDVIERLEGGAVIPGDNLAQGYTHCFTMKFRNVPALYAYRDHAAHQQFVQLLKPRLEKALIVNVPDP